MGVAADRASQVSPTLESTWAETLRADPTAIAVIEAGAERSWTRTDLDHAAKSWKDTYGEALRDRLVVFAELNRAIWLTTFLGLLQSGAVVAALDPGDPLEAQQRLANEIGAAALWSGGRLQGLAQSRKVPRDGRRLVKLTSGTTGRPKALAFTDTQILADGQQVCAGMDIRPHDRNFGLIPFGHSYGIGNLIVPLLAQGTPIIVGSTALPHVIAAEIARHRATVFPAVPALLRSLVESAVDPRTVDTLRLVISAGAPLPTEVAIEFQRKLGRKIHSFYGSTETGGITYDPTGDAALTGRSVGTPLPGVRVSVGRGQRLMVTSPAVFTIGNRLRDHELGFHRLADLAQFTEIGELKLIGRAGRTVKIAGRRLNLAEVERAVRQIPGATDVLVTLHPQRVDVLAAVVAGSCLAEEVKAALRATLASWKIPRKVVVVEKFPVTARGKTDTQKLRAMLAGESGRD